MVMVASSIVILLAWALRSIHSLPFEPIFPPCTTNFFSEGKIDFEAMAYNCSASMPSPMQPPSYYPNNTARTTYSPTVVYVQLALNNLLRVNDLTNQYTLDFYFRIAWVDPRWYMPDLWRYLNPKALIEGIDIAPYIESTNELNIWLPDLEFEETYHADKISQFVRFYENGTFLWSRHMVTTFVDPLMDFSTFPNDHQNFTVTLQSYSYSNQFVTIQFLEDTPVILIAESSVNGGYSIEHNELWDYSGTSANIANIVFPSFTNPNRQFSVAYFNFNFDRQSQGFVYRYSLPIMIFMIIVGISYWADLNKRVDISLQVILVIGAMYLIIGEAVPVVGYLTSMDIYVTTIFTLLTLAVFVHILTIQCHRKRDRYPMQLFLGEAVVLFFRVFWTPASILFFICEFRQYNPFFLTLFVLITLFSILYGYLHIPAVRKAFFTSLYNLRLKKAYYDSYHNPETTEKPKVEDIPFVEHKESIAFTNSEKTVLQMMAHVPLVNTVDGEVIREDEGIRKRVGVK